MRIVRLILGAGLLISCLHFVSSTPALAQAAPKWNILLLFADDQRADTIAALGNRHIQTPNLDRLAKRGVAFDRAYMQGGLNGATCVPSRAMLLSGKSLFRIDEKLMRHETWPSAFQRAGYTTFISGKWHNGVESIGKSFQQGRSIFAGGMTDPMRSKLSQLENGQLTNPQPEKRHACEAFSDEAIRFLTEHRQGPFFCYVPYDAPHDPHIVPDGFPIHYNPADLPLPANYQPQYAWDNGEMVIRDEKLLPWPRTPDAVREMLAEYYRYVSYLDMQIGRVLDALEASPHADRTLVVFCADSGVARGCHGLIGKQNVFEHSMRVPLIVAGPGIPANQRSQAMCYLFDLLPTLGALCGVAGPSTSEGINLAACLTKPTQPAREQLMFAYRDVQRAVSDGRWKLVRYPKTNKTFLFDLANDPDEIYDLADVSTHTATVERLTRLLKSEQLAWGDQVPLEAAMPLQARWSPPTK